MILLLFSSPDTVSSANIICQKLRRAGALLCCPAPDKLPALPFRAVLLISRADRSMLPSPDKLRTHYPDSQLLSICALPRRSSRWNYLSAATHECLLADVIKDPAEYLHTLGLLPTDTTITCRLLRLTASPKHNTLRTRRLTLTPNESRLLRVLAALNGTPVLPETLAGFLARPEHTPTPNQVAAHICGINHRFIELDADKPIIFTREQGYHLDGYPLLTPALIDRSFFLNQE